ncbi:MAG: hypothetical protein R2991_07650 [Thermoanaerobaculia bacterium]
MSRHSGSRSPVLPWLALACLSCLACQGPPGPPGPAGPPGAAGAGLAFYVVEGATKLVSASATDVETLSCDDPADAATGWAMEGAGLVSGPAASGHRSVVPVVTGTTPTGFTFRYVCATAPTCEITNRIVCADLSP